MKKTSNGYEMCEIYNQREIRLEFEKEKYYCHLTEKDLKEMLKLFKEKE